MTAKKETFDKVDRTKFGSGPWDDEPDLIEWIDPATSRQCRIERPPLGHLCGYVAVAKDHSWFEVDDCRVEPHPEVHGGLTYSDHKDGDSSLWWLGFDCAHLGDLVPASRVFHELRGETYKDIAFVTGECERLARQINEAAK